MWSLRFRNFAHSLDSDNGDRLASRACACTTGGSDLDNFSPSWGVLPQVTNSAPSETDRLVLDGSRSRCSAIRWPYRLVPQYLYMRCFRNLSEFVGKQQVVVSPCNKS